MQSVSARPALSALYYRAWDGRVTSRLTDALLRYQGAGPGLLECILWHPDARVEVSEELACAVVKSFPLTALHAMLKQSRSILTVTPKVINSARVNRNHGDEIMEYLVRSADTDFGDSVEAVTLLVHMFGIKPVHAFFSQEARRFPIKEDVFERAICDSHSRLVSQLLLQYMEWAYVHERLEDWLAFQERWGHEFDSLYQQKVEMLERNGSLSKSWKENVSRLGDIYRVFHVEQEWVWDASQQRFT